MGQSSPAEQVSPEQREAESIAASTGALPNLQKAFSVLSDPQTNSIPIHSLQKCFGFSIDGSTNEESVVPKEFPVLMSNLSSSIVDLFFLSEKGGISWVEFLKGYIKCSGRTVSSTSLNSLLRLFGMISVKAGLPEKLQVVSDEDDCKISGFLLPVDVQMLLSMCWVMWWDSNKLKASSSLGDSGLPDVTHLVLSAIDSCAEADKKMDLWETSILDMDIQLPVIDTMLMLTHYLCDLLRLFTTSFLSSLCIFIIYPFICYEMVTFVFQCSICNLARFTGVQIQKTGSVGRSIDVSGFKNYEELRSEIERMFGLEGLLNDTQGSSCRLVYVDFDNDVLLVGDDPWEEFVGCVRCIRIISPTEVQKIGEEGMQLLNSAGLQGINGLIQVIYESSQ